MWSGSIHGDVQSFSFSAPLLTCEAGAYYFDGTTTDDYVLYSMSEYLPTEITSFSQSLWVRYTGTTLAITSWATDSQQNTVILWQGEETFTPYINGNDYPSDVHLNDDTWHYITLTWDTSGEMNLYVDGAAVYSWTGVETGLTLSNTGTLSLGQEQDCNGGCWDINQALTGYTHDFVFHDYALTLEKASAVYYGAEASGYVFNMCDEPAHGNIEIVAFSPDPVAVADDYTGTDVAFYFDGTTTDNYVSFVMSDFLSSDTTAASMSAWVRVSCTECAISSWATSSHNNHLLLWVNENGFITPYVNGGAYASNLAYNDDVWHHLTFTWDTTGDMALYTDGALAYSWTGISTGFTLGNSGTQTLGQEQDCDGGCFDVNQALVGYIADYRFFDYALDSSAVWNVYEGLSENAAIYECPDGTFVGTLLECTADACPGAATGTGYNSECEDLVTDGSCTQTCAAGYISNGDGVHTCPAGVFTGNVLVCTVEAVSAEAVFTTPESTFIDEYVTAADDAVVDECIGCVVSITDPTIVYNTNLGEVDMPADFEISFDITPRGTNSGWSNIVHFSQGVDYGTPGDRMPAIWFRPSTYELHICHDEVSVLNVCYNSAALTQDISTNVRVVYTARSAFIYFDDEYQGSLSFSSDRVTGTATMYMSDPWYAAANADIGDFRVIDSNVAASTAASTAASAPVTYFTENVEGVVVSLPEATVVYNTNLGEVDMPYNFEISFDITPRGTDSNWANFVHFTQGGNHGTPGDRMPAIWFRPNTYELHICHDEISSVNICFNSRALTQDVTTNLRVVYYERTAEVYFDGGLEGTLTFSNERATGTATMYMSDPWYAAANADVANFLLADSELYHATTTQTDAGVTSPASVIVIETANGTPVASTNVGQATIPTNFELSLDITPLGKVSDWSNFVHFTGTGENNAGGGSRMPAIWFRPNAYELHICVDTETTTNTCYNSRALTQDVSTNLKVRFYEYSFEIYLDGVLEGTIGLSSSRITGDCDVYISDPWYPAANAEVTNLVGLDMDASSWEENWFDDINFDTSSDVCDPNPCANGACVYGYYDSIGEIFLCECYDGYSGELCEEASSAEVSEAVAVDTIPCEENQHVSSGACVDCAAGTTNAAGDDSSGLDTSCTATLCDADQYVSGHICVACAAGTTNAANDDASGSDTSCDITYCGENYYVSNHECVECPAGTTHVGANDDASSSDTSCDATLCAADHYVSGNTCVACAAGTTNTANDDASGSDTSCDDVACPADSEGSNVASGCVCDPGHYGTITASTTSPYYTGACTAGDCSTTVPSAPGYNTECDDLFTDQTCTQTCSAGYSDNNNGAGQTYTCPDGELLGTLLVCTPDSCPGYSTSEGVGSGCDGLVTDGSCTQACAAGYTSNGGGSHTCPDGVFSGTTLTCTPISCAADFYVSDHTCVACAAGTSNAAGDLASGSNTACDITYCAENEYVSGHACVACASGYENEAGDDASGDDTSCYEGTYTVTCTFTVDNHASHVYVNGVEMSVDGDMNDWTVGKTFSFEDGTINGETYIIAIDGYNAETCDGTTCSAGLMIGCSSTWAESVWNDVYSSTTDDRFLTISESWGDVMPPEWVEEDFQCNSGRWGLPIASTSTFTCSDCQAMHPSAQAVWAVRNLQYGWFRISVPYAQELVPSTTVSTGRLDD
jgi:hypothetical protein